MSLYITGALRDHTFIHFVFLGILRKQALFSQDNYIWGFEDSRTTFSDGIGAGNY